MNPIKAIVNIFVIALSVLGIAACGGGGGNGGSSSISVPTAGVSISTSNAKPVSAAILKSIETVEGTTTGTTVLSGVSVSAPASNFNYADFFVRQLSRLPEMDIIPSSTVSGVFISGSAGCTNGGTVSGT
ncbi:MAG: hypothetical protein KZQ77_11010, partial [Candidatus Thiodiazotropha sp. (ex Notomyrtea botanica)]|nr:hypothetical protein [Candidatus Thiodiazotropha sp. (ex Notomyrtea botanica)]